MYLSLLAAGMTSLVAVPWDRIASEPQVWPASGVSIARHLTSCLSLAKKGVLIVPYEFYVAQGQEPPLRGDCPEILLVHDPRLPFPPELRLYPGLLSPYRVDLYRAAELTEFIEDYAARKAAGR